MLSLSAKNADFEYKQKKPYMNPTMDIVKRAKKCFLESGRGGEKRKMIGDGTIEMDGTTLYSLGIGNHRLRRRLEN